MTRPSSHAAHRYIDCTVAIDDVATELVARTNPAVDVHDDSFHNILHASSTSKCLLHRILASRG